MICFLRVGNDSVEEATRCPSIKYAIAEYRVEAEELARYDQRLDASIHIARSMAEVAEYPDYVLSLGPKGGVIVGRT